MNKWLNIDKLEMVEKKSSALESERQAGVAEMLRYAGWTNQKLKNRLTNNCNNETINR